MLLSSSRDEEPANILAAPAPDFFFQAAPAPSPGFFSSGSGSVSKETKTPSSDRLRLPSPACYPDLIVIGHAVVNPPPLVTLATLTLS